MQIGDIVADRRSLRYPELNMRITNIKGELLELESVRTGKPLTPRRKDEVKLV